MEQPRNSKVNSNRWEMDKVRYHLETPPAPNRDIRGIDAILQDVVDGLEQPVQENVLLLRKVWPELVGVQIAKHSEPGFIQENALHIWVDHPGWLTELERMKRPLQHKLQSRYRELRIRQIRFLLQR